MAQAQTQSPSPARGKRRQQHATKRSPTRSLVELAPKSRVSPTAEAKAAFPTSAHTGPGAGGDAGAGSRQEQGLEAAREALP